MHCEPGAGPAGGSSRDADCQGRGTERQQLGQLAANSWGSLQPDIHQYGRQCPRATHQGACTRWPGGTTGQRGRCLLPPSRRSRRQSWRAHGWSSRCRLALQGQRWRSRGVVSDFGRCRHHRTLSQSARGRLSLSRPPTPVSDVHSHLGACIGLAAGCVRQAGARGNFVGTALREVGGPTAGAGGAHNQAAAAGVVFQRGLQGGVQRRNGVLEQQPAAAGREHGGSSGC